MKEIKIDTFDGHLVLLCKNWYTVKGVDFFTSVKRLWAVRCGLDKEYATDHLYENIADHLVNIILQYKYKENPIHLFEILHREVDNDLLNPRKLTAIEKMIWEYRSIVGNLKIRDVDKKVVYVRLPKPQKQIVKRIVRGNGRYKDYELLTKIKQNGKNIRK